ncbi:MAG: DUF2341 domain-containing protein [Planctomycetota bacterium]
MKRTKTGSVLSIVLIFSFVLFLIGAAILVKVTTGNRLAGMNQNKTRAFYYAEAGLNRALWQLQPDEDWSDNTPPANLYSDEPLENGTYTVTLNKRNKSDLEIISSGRSGLLVEEIKVKAVRSPAVNWWKNNFSYRQRLAVNNPATITLLADYSVAFIFNTQTLIADGKMQANGNDLRIVYNNGSQLLELDRDVVNLNSTATEVWFKTQTPVPAGSSDTNYFIYYGNTLADPAPQNKGNVYYFFDDFNRPDYSYAGPKWLVPTRLRDEISNNQLNLRSGTAEGYIIANMVPLTNFICTYRVRIKLNEGSFVFRSASDRVPAYANRMQAINRGGRFYVRLTSTWNIVGINWWTPSRNTWYNMKLVILGNNLQGWVDGVLRLNETDSQIAIPGYVGCWLGENNSEADYDDVVVRQYQSPEPTVTATAEEKAIDGTKPGIIYWQKIE